MGRPSGFKAGAVFGRLTMVLQEGTRCICRCSCGTLKWFQIRGVTNGDAKSCGCLFTEQLIARNTTHGMAKTSIYGIWSGMITRCYNPKRREWKWYGGRGITVCKRWHKFENFFADMGDRPLGLSVDRKDNDKGYSPRNCRWATTAEQAANKSTSRRA